MAQQFQDHASRAPYPYFAKKLQTLAEEEMKHARRLREQILSMGESVEPGEIRTKNGWNHWERLVVDLDDERVQEALYQDQAVQTEGDEGTLRELLFELAGEEARHIGILRDLRSEERRVGKECRL